jgi:hypothetical protein
MEKKSDRKRYNPDGKNTYSQPKNKPPRYDLRRRHRVIDDPLEKKDKLNEESRMSTVEEIEDKEIVIAKKLAKKRIRVASERKPYHDTGYNVARDGLDNYKFKEKGMKAVAKTYRHLADAFLSLTKATNTFTSCKSSEVSPDGKLGGRGYIKPIKEIRKSFADAINTLSELIDTFHDEVNSPYWKKTTVEDHPFVKEILDEADKLIDEAEDLDEKNPNMDLKDPSKMIEAEDPSKIVLSETEKEKIKAILDYKEKSRH